MLTTLTARVLEGSTRSSGARLDAYRVDGAFHIDIDLPGVDSASIDITADGEAFTVRAERRRPEREAPPAGIAERREVLLSERLDTDRIDARYVDGVLTLSIPVLERLPFRSVHELQPVQVDELAAVVRRERDEHRVDAADRLEHGGARTP